MKRAILAAVAAACLTLSPLAQAISIGGTSAGVHFKNLQFSVTDLDPADAYQPSIDFSGQTHRIDLGTAYLDAAVLMSGTPMEEALPGVGRVLIADSPELVPPAHLLADNGQTRIIGDIIPGATSTSPFSIKLNTAFLSEPIPEMVPFATVFSTLDMGSNGNGSFTLSPHSSVTLSGQVELSGSASATDRWSHGPYDALLLHSAGWRLTLSSDADTKEQQGGILDIDHYFMADTLTLDTVSLTLSNTSDAPMNVRLGVLAQTSSAFNLEFAPSVPEPEAAALVLAGLAVMSGGGLRRRRR